MGRSSRPVFVRLRGYFRENRRRRRDRAADQYRKWKGGIIGHMNRIVIKKAERRLQLFDGEKLIKTYTGALGFMPAGDKEIEGDGKTPEGEFYVFVKNEKSKYYL